MKRMFWSVLILFPWYIYIWELKAACTSLKTVLCYSWCHNWFASSRTWSWRVIPLNMMCQASATLFCRLVSVIVVFFFLSSSFLSSMGERCSVVSYLSFSCWIMGFTLLSSGIWGHKIGERKKKRHWYYKGVAVYTHLAQTVLFLLGCVCVNFEWIPNVICYDIPSFIWFCSIYYAYVQRLRTGNWWSWICILLNEYLYFVNRKMNCTTFCKHREIRQHVFVMRAIV